MEPTQIREELHQFIDRANESVLNLIYDMMKADIEAQDQSKPHKQLLDERLENEDISQKGPEWKDI